MIDPLTHVKPGDPDENSFTNSDEDCCRFVSQFFIDDRGDFATLCCTRGVHPSEWQHIAGTGKVVVGVSAPGVSGFHRGGPDTNS